jgi:hypothetical protein
MNEADTCRKFVVLRGDRVKTSKGLSSAISLNDLPEKYASDYDPHFTLPDVLKVRGISNHG